MKKILRNKEIVKATRKFTDREQPRKVFWNHYNSLKENMENNEDIHIITYYGVGGIGKSSLLRKLVEELRKEDSYYVLYDFETAQDVKTVLTLIKNQLEKDYNFEFPIFDLALYSYARKIGENPDKPEIKSMIENSRTLSFVMDALDEIPIIGMASTVFKLFDSGMAVLKNKSGKYKSDLIKLESEAPEETYKKLPYYFSQDLANNIESLNKPLVILLDTYEKLVNEVNSEGFTLMKDMWLRDDEGPILQVPGVIWVLAGREKIKWGEYDKDWDETLDQHILGDLSFYDADDFLKEAGIEEEQLRKDIYELTHGTPVYLDICVSTYEILKSNNEEATIDKFGKNVDALVERFIRYMDIQSSEMTYVLSIIENWSDEMIKNVGYEILPNFSITLYEKIKKLSFIFYENEKYYIHKTVKDILQRECPESLKNKVLEVINDYYWNFLADNTPLNEEFMNNVNSFISTTLLTVNEDNADEEIDYIDQLLDYLEQYHLYPELKQILDYVSFWFKKKFPESKNLYLFDMQYANLSHIEGNSTEAVKIYENVIEYWISNNILNVRKLTEITDILLVSGISNKEKVLSFLSYIENFDISNIEKDEYFSYSFFYASEAQLYRCLNNKDKVIQMYEKALQNTELKYEKAAMLLSIIDILNKDDTRIKKITYYIEELEKLLEENDDEINDSYYHAMIVIAKRYLDSKISNLEKALYWLDKAELYSKKILGNNHVLNLEEPHFYYKTYVLSKINKESCEEYAEKVLDIINTSYNTDNINVEETILRITGLIDQEKKLDLYNKLLNKYTGENADIEKLYIIAYYISADQEKEILYKYVNTILDVVEKEGINDNNIVIFEKFIYTVLAYTDDYKLTLSKLDDLYEYYRNKNGEDSEMATSVMIKKIGFYESILEDYNKAIEVAKDLYNIYIRKYGENSVEVADILEILGVAYDKLGKEESLECFNKALNIYIKVVGENAIETLRVEHSIIASLPIEEAIIKLEEYYKKIVDLFGDSEEMVHEVLNEMSTLYFRLEKMNKSLETDLKLYEIYKKTYGEKSEKTYKKLEDVCADYANISEYDKALEINMEIYDIYKDLYGENDERTCKRLEYMSLEYYGLNSYDKALEIDLKLYNKYKELYGEKSEQAYKRLSDIELEYNKLEMYDKSLEANLKLYDIYKDLYGENDEKTYKKLEDISLDYYKLGEYEKCIEIDKKLYEIYVKEYGSDSVNVYKKINEISSTYSKLNKYDDALKILTDVYDDMIRNDDDRCRNLAIQFLMDMAYLNVQNDNIEEARKQALEVYKDIDCIKLSIVSEIRHMNNLTSALIACSLEREAKIVLDKILLVLDDIVDKNKELYNDVLINKEKLE